MTALMETLPPPTPPSNGGVFRRAEDAAAAQLEEWGLEARPFDPGFSQLTPRLLSGAFSS